MATAAASLLALGATALASTAPARADDLVSQHLVQDSDISADGSTIVYSYYCDEGCKKFVLDTRSGRTTPLRNENGGLQSTGIAVSDDGSRVVWGGSTSKHVMTFVFNTRTKKTRTIPGYFPELQANAYPDELWRSDSARYVSASQPRPGTTRYGILDTTKGTFVAARPPLAGDVSPQSLSPNGRYLLYAVSNKGHGGFYRLDRTTGASTRLADDEAAKTSQYNFHFNNAGSFDAGPYRQFPLPAPPSDWVQLGNFQYFGADAPPCNGLYAYRVSDGQYFQIRGNFPGEVRPTDLHVGGSLLTYNLSNARPRLYRLALDPTHFTPLSGYPCLQPQPQP